MGDIRITPSGALRGSLRVPGDKSITHRALFFAALNSSTTRIENPSPADDCVRTRELVRALGRDVTVETGALVIRRGAARPTTELTLDCGNSGTTARLAMGLLAAEPGLFRLVGDRSLSARPMERVTEPLRRIGASIVTSHGALPASITGGTLDGGTEPIGVASAQVHAALVLAGLRSREGVSLTLAKPMRDHTLRMLARFGVPLDAANGVHRLLPTAIDRDLTVQVPGDVSSAAFLVTAAILVPGSEITIDGVGLNPTRVAYLRALETMGARLSVEVAADSFEPVGTITAAYSPELRGVRFDEREAVSVAEMIDELPLLALVATRASGRTGIADASELRVKESDRIATTASVLRAYGADVEEHPDGLVVVGPQRLVARSTVDPKGDHRLAMMAAVAALVSGEPATIAGADAADVSYPAYWRDLGLLGAGVERI